VPAHGGEAVQKRSSDVLRGGASDKIWETNPKAPLKGRGRVRGGKTGYVDEGNWRRLQKIKKRGGWWG